MTWNIVGRITGGFERNWPLLGGVLLIGIVLRTQYGTWLYCDVSVADEAGRSASSLISFLEGNWTLSAYDLLYMCIFQLGFTDLLSAAMIMRIVGTVISVMGLYILVGLSGLSTWTGALLAAVFWNINNLNVPLIQDYPMSQICFGLAASSIGLWIRGGTLNNCAAFILVVLAGNARPEFYLIPSLYLFSFLFPASANDHSMIDQNPISRVATFFLLFLSVSGGGLILFWPKVLSILNHFDSYLFFGFSQCYSAYVQTHEAARFPSFNWATDYQIVMQNDFKNANNIKGLLFMYPFEVTRYFFLNMLNNIKEIPGLFDVRSMLLGATVREAGPALWRWIVVGENIFFKGILLYSMLQFWYVIWHERLVLNQKTRRALIWGGALAIVSLPALLLLIPRVRYWITLIPLAYLPLGWYVSRVSIPFNTISKVLIITFSCICFSQPFFIFSFNMKEQYNANYVKQIRQMVSDFPKQKKASVLSIHHDPFFNLADPMRFELHSFLGLDERLSLNHLVGLRYDFIVLDDISKTFRFEREQKFVDTFRTTPETFGYRAVYNFRLDWGKGTVYRLIDNNGEVSQDIAR